MDFYQETSSHTVLTVPLHLYLLHPLFFSTKITNKLIHCSMTLWFYNRTFNKYCWVPDRMVMIYLLCGDKKCRWVPDHMLHPKSSRDSPSLQWPCYGFLDFSDSSHLSHPSSWLFHLLIHPQIPSPFAFHVSKLRFVPCFHFTLHFRSLVLFLFPEPWPWYMPDSHYPTYTFRTSCMFLSLKSTLIVPRTPCPDLRTLTCPSPKIQGQ